MRTKLGAAFAGLTAVAGGALIAGAAQAQTYYYSPAPTYYYNPPPSAYYVPTTPAYVAPSYYAAPGVAGAVIGTILGADAYAAVPGVPVDQYGPDPNGMLAPDGHRLKCKLRTGFDSYHDAYMTHRECWEED